MKWIELIGETGFEHIEFEDQNDKDVVYQAFLALDCTLTPREYIFDDGVIPRIINNKITVLFHDDDDIMDVTVELGELCERMIDRLFDCAGPIDFLLQDETLSKQEVWDWYKENMMPGDSKEEIEEWNHIIIGE